MTRNSCTLTAMIATAFAVAALPAVAEPVNMRSPDGFVMGAEEGGWSLEQYSYFLPESRANAPKAVAIAGGERVPARVDDAYRFVGGETGWQLKPHKLVLAGGRIAHSEECDHAIRTAQAPTSAEVERARNFSPGA